MIIRLLVNDIELYRNVDIPDNYVKCYRIEGTNTWMFCKKPFHITLIAAHKTAKFITCLLAIPISLYFKLYTFAMKQMFAKGTTYEEFMAKK